MSIYTDKLVSLVNLTDSEGQRGQYFGGSVAVTDLNNDGFAKFICILNQNLLQTRRYHRRFAVVHGLYDGADQ